MIQNSKGHSCWTRVSISIGVGLFLLALALSAVIVPQLLYLHLLQALIYLAVLVLTQRNNAWGYGIGVIVPTAWNCLNLFVTHLFQKGAMQFWSLCAHGACEPASADAGDGWGRGPLSAHHRLHNRVPAAAASRKAMGQVLWRGLSGLRLLRLDYSHRKTALAFIMQGRMAKQGRQRVLG